MKLQPMHLPNSSISHSLEVTITMAMDATAFILSTMVILPLLPYKMSKAVLSILSTAFWRSIKWGFDLFYPIYAPIWVNLFLFLKSIGTQLPQGSQTTDKEDISKTREGSEAKYKIHSQCGLMGGFCGCTPGNAMESESNVKTQPFLRQPALPSLQHNSMKAQQDELVRIIRMESAIEQYQSQIVKLVEGCQQLESLNQQLNHLQQQIGKLSQKTAQQDYYTEVQQKVGHKESAITAEGQNEE